MRHMPQAHQCITQSERVHRVSSRWPGPTNRGREPTRVCRMACVLAARSGLGLVLALTLFANPNPRSNPNASPYTAVGLRAA